MDLYIVDYGLSEKIFARNTHKTPYNSALRFQEELIESGIISTVVKIIGNEEHHVRTSCIETLHGIDSIIYL